MEPFIIELPEYETKSYCQNIIPEYIGKLIFDKYSNQVEIEFPTYKTNNMWKLKNRGWVGYIPLTNTCGISLKPKVKIADVFKMWEYAYKLKSFQFLVVRV
jgi:5-methylcytosine-specific restriction enzyme subunit McrC